MPSQHRLVKHEGEDGKEAGGWLRPSRTSSRSCSRADLMPLLGGGKREEGAPTDSDKLITSHVGLSRHMGGRNVSIHHRRNHRRAGWVRIIGPSTRWKARSEIWPALNRGPDWVEGAAQL